MMTPSGGPSAMPAMSIGDLLMQADRSRAAGGLMEAEALCRRVLEMHPNQADALHLLGLVAHQRGQLSEAIEQIKRAIKSAPQNALFHCNVGEMLRLAGRPRDAVTYARRALDIDPNMASAWSNLGVALYELKDYEEAARAHRKSIAANPQFALAHSNLGNALHGLKRFNEAIECYERAIALDPNFADAWANYGTSCHHAGRFEDGIFALRRAIALNPQHANARSGLGILLLMRGDLAEGWDEYDWRLRSSERTGPRFPERPWQGESLAGKHIYVQAEQGFGDALQFARYLPLLAARAGKVSFRVHQQLAAVMRESLPGINVLGDRGDLPAYDCDAVLLSLPKTFRTRFETIPATVPYLRAPADIAANWTRRFVSKPGLKVGLVWAGNPEHVNDHRRSVDLALLARVLAVPGTSFVSLQVGPRAADLTKKPLRGLTIEDVSPALTDYSETAGAIAALDLVITVDTSVAHIAGALGKPVWVLLPWISDWRWLLKREDNPWYPNMRLYRQKRGVDDWDDVLARMTGDLAAVAQGDPTRLMPFKTIGDRRAGQAAELIAVEAIQMLAPPQPQKLNPGQLLMLAEQKRRHGFIADAEEHCQEALAIDPNFADAVQLLGIMAQQSGKLPQAIDLMRRATALQPNVALYHSNLGEMCRMAGRVDEAIVAGKRAIELEPDYPGALSNLGIAYYDKGDFEGALGAIDRALALDPNFALGHSNRGNALQRLKRFAEAEPSYRRSIELEPRYGDAWNNLGTCLRELKHPDEAEAAYRKALELKPLDPDTLDNLALALKDLERHDEAADLFRRALAIEARNENIHVHYGSVLLDLDKVDEAAAAAGRALSLNPNNHEAVNMMGRVAFEREQAEEALHHFRRALEIKPDLADAYNNMGNVLKELGRLDEAHACYVKALEIDPDTAGVYVNLVDSMKFTKDSPYLAKLEALAGKSDGLSPTDRCQLDFALGKVYGDLKDHTRSFQRLLSANAGKRAQISYDEPSALGLFDDIERVFSAKLIEAKSGGGDPSQMPIFVLGMPRSGTTLVEQILASHPMVHGAGELKTLNDVVLDVRGADGQSLRYPDFMNAIDADALRQIGARYVERVRQRAPASDCVTDKMPSNYYFAGLIHLALPHARIIHTMRDPVDTCISCFSKLFSDAQDHTYDLGELGRYHKRYQRLMKHWHSVLPKGRILDVAYEDVVADLETQARRIVAYCELPWDNRCLSFHETERPVRTASASQVRQPIYNSAVGRWKVYEEFLGPLLAGLG